MGKKNFLLLLFFPIWLGSVEYKPWFGQPFELETRSSYVLQTFRSLKTSCGKRHYPSADSFYTLDILLPLMSEWDVEWEVTMLDTRRHPLNLDDMSLTVRTLWLSDVIGDSFSLSTGATLAKVFKAGRHDIGTFHHGGGLEAEAHIAMGKECSWMQFWLSRYWGVLAVGTADVGSPWIKSRAAWELHWSFNDVFSVYLHTLWGLGGQRLCLENFHGYGPIRHQSIDAGIMVEHLFDFSGKIKAEYARRVHARNCPKEANLLFVTFIYPLGLGI